MNNPQAALLRQRDGHVRFGDGVHGGADDGNVEADVARELRLGAGLRRDYVGARGEKKDVIESKSFGNGKMNHKLFGYSRVRGRTLIVETAGNRGKCALMLSWCLTAKSI
jgi:hypothetical protein